MLGMRNYTQEYIDACRSKVDADLLAYKKMAKKAAGDKTLTAFETTFFNNTVLVLDHLFVHRLRTVEGKDGNPLNEVRVICDSILLHDGVMTADKSIELIPTQSILKIEFGGAIKIKEADFVRISDAFFTEIEKKYR